MTGGAAQKSIACPTQRRNALMAEIGTDRQGIQAFDLPTQASDAQLAEFDVRSHSLPRRVQHYLHANPTVVPAIVLLIGVVAFGLTVGTRFLSTFNLSLIIQQVTIIGIIGIAQALIVITAGIDLSVGAIMVLCSVIMGKLAVVAGVPAPLALGVGVGVGAGCGAMNGVLVTSFRLPP